MLAVTCSPEDEADAEMWWEDHEHALAAGIDLAAESATVEQELEVRCEAMHSSWRQAVVMQFCTHADMARTACNSATELSVRVTSGHGRATAAGIYPCAIRNRALDREASLTEGADTVGALFAAWAVLPKLPLLLTRAGFAPRSVIKHRRARSLPYRTR